jgi:DNA repair protein RecN (Recombination protein N)
MARIADSHQVFCVTHLPQVASLGAQHFIVEKLQDESETQVSITPIHTKQEQRLGEIARMLGDRNSQSALDHAKELLS